MMKNNKSGFTLIELLIVVAIIAILAAIAIPNFLAAQTRSKVARVRADHRSLATAIESYYVDNNSYPLATIVPISMYLPDSLTTPIAYISSIMFSDPFRAAIVPDPLAMRYRYLDMEAAGFYLGNMPALVAYSDVYGKWRLSSSGPDRFFGPTNYFVHNGFSWNFLFPYDPTNGTVSVGDIMRSQKNPDEVSRPPFL